MQSFWRTFHATTMCPSKSNAQTSYVILPNATTPGSARCCHDLQVLICGHDGTAIYCATTAHTVNCSTLRVMCRGVGFAKSRGFLVPGQRALRRPWQHPILHKHLLLSGEKMSVCEQVELVSHYSNKKHKAKVR